MNNEYAEIAHAPIANLREALAIIKRNAIMRADHGAFLHDDMRSANDGSELFCMACVLTDDTLGADSADLWFKIFRSQA